MTVQLAAGAVGAVPPLAPNAMPGIYRTGLAMRAAPAPSAAFAASLGYGYTEPQADGDSSHHRQSARLGAAVWPTPWMGASVRIDERYDLHPNARTGGDDGLIVDPSFSIRCPFPIAEHLFLAPDLSLWFPASEDASTSLASTTFDARLLATTIYDSMIAGITLGYRVDRSRNAGKNASGLRPGDRLALGLSSFDAVTAALGGSYSLGRTAIKGEVSADLPVGAGAPPVLQSPIRVGVGVGQQLVAALMLDVLLEAGLSARPILAPDSPLLPVEPRITAIVGLRYQLDFATAAPRPSPPAPAPPPVSNVQPPAPVPLDIRLTDEDGQPILDAKVKLEAEGQIYPLTNAGGGNYRLDAAPLGDGSIHVEADGSATLDRAISIGSSPQTIEIKTSAKIPSSQVRGLVRSMQGRPLRATIRVEPSGTEVKADESGRFEIDLKPGIHDVVVEAAGYQSQRRHINLQQRGVIVINADLAKGGH